MTDEKNSVVIFSHPNDIDTKNVIQWLNYFDQKYLLISSITDIIENNYILNADWIHRNVKSVWFRKLNFTIEMHDSKNRYLINSLKKFLISEVKAIYDLIDFLYKEKKTLGKVDKMDVEKISTLLIAQKIGLKIPDFLITTKKSELIDFLKSNKKIITKPIFNTSQIYFSSTKHFYMYSSLVDELKDLEDYFFPSLLQKYINKVFEVRTFYLDGKLFSAGFINSKDNELIDCRNLINTELIYFPIDLPKAISNKIIKLMKQLNLKTGSLDILYSTDKEYYFIEVNPCGQFEVLSNACSYKLEKEVALWLIN